MISKKKLTLIFGAALLTLASCGTEDEDDETGVGGASLTATGSCAISTEAADQTFVQCLEYVDKSSVIVAAAEDACVSSSDSATATWADSACSTTGSHGSCAIDSDGSSYTTVYSGTGYTPALAESDCDSNEGTFTPAS